MKKHTGIIAAIVLLLGFAQIAQADTIRGIDMGFASITNAGNPADVTGYGAVSYDYRIATYEVTIAQFTTARAADNNIGSGNENYWNDGTRTAGTNAPATKVSWFEAATFCNWLTTGSAYDGAYQFDGSGTLTNVMDRAQIRADGGLFYVLPTEDEWYKAAYFTGSGYSLYANGTDTPPVGGTNANPEANYAGTSGNVNQEPNLTWAFGTGAKEQNGTYDMMGNVEEWLTPWSGTGTVRGGMYDDVATTLSSDASASRGLASEYGSVGFRVVSIPEPTVVSLLALSGVAVLGIRRFFGSEK